MKKTIHRFGFWPSGVSAASVADGALRFGRVQVTADAVFWSESRPAEKGRAPVMRWTEAQGVAELLPAPFSARSRVHEYGGGEFLVAGERLFFVNDADQDVYVLSAIGTGEASGIERLTNMPDTRFADFTWDSRRERLIGVGETHDQEGRHLPENELWMIPAMQAGAGGTVARVLSGRGFYASPRVSPDGRRLAFLAWDLPFMPWDSAQLFVADIEEAGSLGEPVLIAGGQASACFRPEWGADNTLYFVWDSDGLGNLFAWDGTQSPQKITTFDAELSLPLWSLNAASYALCPGDTAYCSFIRNGEAGAAIAELTTGQTRRDDNGFTAVQTLAAGAAGIALCGLKDDEPACIGLIPLEGGAAATPQLIRRSSNSGAIDAGYIVPPSRIEIPSAHGPIHGLLYRPANPAPEAPASSLPPLIINLHGGPTTSAARGLKPRTVFFTSRGFSWLDLDYAGSTGYGRAYRERLRGNWGIADVEDTICAARYAGTSGLADPNAIFVSGGSAGGYTVLMAIATAPVFRGAASYYGICDLIALQNTTHKFEQGYQAALLGAPLPEGEAVYKERSAIEHVGRISTPLIIFQGEDDNVVTKDQALSIAQALRAKGILVEYHEFAGEGHGFRRADNIQTCLERELSFYRKLIGCAGVSG